MAIIYSLDVRCQKILNTILDSQGYLNIQEIADENKVSLRSVYYDIEKINEWLHAFDIDEIILERRKGVVLTAQHIKLIRDAIKTSNQDIDYLFTPTQRTQIIICSIIIKNKMLFIEDFISLCKVSRNTIISDLKNVNSLLNDYGLSLQYEVKSGYYLQGDILKQISLFFLCLNDLSEYYKKGIIILENSELIYEYDERLNLIEMELNTKYVSGVLFNLAIFCASTSGNAVNFEFDINYENEIKVTKEFELVEKYFSMISYNYKLYIALHLLGSRLQTIPMGLMIDDNDKVYEMAKDIVVAFSNIACVDFSKFDLVVTALFAHLKSSMYRYKYGIQLINPMLAGIKQEYYELFILTKKACHEVQKKYGLPISESEIAYITLHFGGFIIGSNEQEHDLKILVICPNGVSTGNMLKAEISALIPHATKIDNLMLSEIDKSNLYDVVVSTVHIEDFEDILVVHPILTDSDRITILRKCMVFTKENKAEIEAIIKIASSFIPKNQINDFKKQLQHHFGSSSVLTRSTKNFGSGMINHLPENNITVCNTNYNWQEAIAFASAPLLDNGTIEERYVDNIVEKLNKMGPYMFITENVVLAHAGINDGVNRLGISMVNFKKPILFSENRFADIIIVLSTKDQISHIKILNDIMNVFSNKKTVTELSSKNTSREILEYIQTVLAEK